MKYLDTLALETAANAAGVQFKDNVELLEFAGEVYAVRNSWFQTRQRERTRRWTAGEVDDIFDEAIREVAALWKRGRRNG